MITHGPASASLANPHRVPIVLYLPLAINTYMELFTADLKPKVCSETGTLGLKRSMWLAIWTEDADGGHSVVLRFEKLSAEIMQLACAPFCASGCQSAFSFYTKIKLALAISLTFLPGVSFACCKTLFMSSGRGEK